MQDFFWCTFGVFFIIASVIGLLTIISDFYDLIWIRKRIKKAKKKGNKNNHDDPKKDCLSLGTSSKLYTEMEYDERDKDSAEIDTTGGRK